MTKAEINEYIENSFKKITRHFHKAIRNLAPEEIRDFRTEVKRLKVFLHLINMESEDGLSYRISKRMKTIYGYFGIIQNFQLQLKTINEYVKKSDANIPDCYVNILEKELEYWKKLSHDFIREDYEFIDDKQEMLGSLPNKLTKKSIKRFIDYTLYELNSISDGFDDEEVLNNVRKFLEDIYYNYPIISNFIDQHETPLFNEKSIEECLNLFGDFHDKCVSLALLKTFNLDTLNEREKELLKEMENEWFKVRNNLKINLIYQLNSMHIGTIKVKRFSVVPIVHE
jgi:hypothetical protein